NYRINHYTPGGAGVRAFLNLENDGARMWSTGISMSSSSGIGQPTSDTAAFNEGIDLSNCNTGLVIRACNSGGIGLISQNGTNKSGIIYWDFPPSGSVNDCGIVPSSLNGGLTLRTFVGTFGGAGEPPQNGWLQFLAAGSPLNPTGALAAMAWGGWFHLAGAGTSGQRPYMIIDWTGDATNYERAFLGWGAVGVDQNFF